MPTTVRMITTDRGAELCPILDYASGVHVTLTAEEPATELGPFETPLVLLFWTSGAKFAFRGDGEPAVYRGNGSVTLEGMDSIGIMPVSVDEGETLSLVRDPNAGSATIHLDVVPYRPG